MNTPSRKRLLLSRYAAVIVVLVVITVSSGSSLAQGSKAAKTDGKISAAIQGQIAAILAAKSNFTAGESKMSSNLAFSSAQSRGVSLGAATSLLRAPETDAVGGVTVEMRAEPSKPLLRLIKNSGGEVQEIIGQYNYIRATIPAGALNTVAESPDVFWMHEPDTMMTNAGSLTSQGYVTHQAKDVVEGLGINGTGVKVGVLSDSASAARVAALIASGDLGPGTTVLEASSGTDEGAAMMEIVQDIAPGAQIYFATANGGQAHFASNIAALAAAGCSIIVDDITYFAEGAFQDGPIAQAVNTFVAANGIYFSAAANSGNKDSGTSGTWEGDFLNGGPVSGVVGGSETGIGFFHNFGTVATPQNFDVMTATSRIITLKWSDPLGSSTNDYDIFILNSTGTTIKGFSATRQNGTQDPFEQVTLPTSGGNVSAVGDQVVVVNFGSGAARAPAQTEGAFAIGATRALRVDTNRGQLSINTAGSTFGHNGGQSTTTMAATYWNSARIGTKPFNGTNNPIEVFSSDGPRKIFYNPNGTPITPGNVLFATNGGTTLNKPDLTAADGVTAKTPGFNPFFGTSAAAPHAAGIAALVKSAGPFLTGPQIRQIMINTALDNMTPGFDRNGGNGVTMALPAVQAPFPCRPGVDCTADP